MTEEQIKKLSEDKAIEAGYIQSDKEYFETTHWTQHNIYKEGVVEGYKAAMLQGMEEISMLKKQLSEQRSSAVMNEQGLLELNRNIYETSIDDLLSWLKNNHYLPQTEETIQKITDQFYKEKNIKPALQNKGEWITMEDKDEILNSLYELIRSISRAINKKEFIKSIDLPRLEKAKSVLAKHSNNSEKIIQSTPPEQ